MCEAISFNCAPRVWDRVGMRRICYDLQARRDCGPMGSKSKKTTEKPTPEIPYSSRKPIRHAYDKALTAVARLLSFSVCLSVTDGAVDDRQGELAVDDLIALCIHGRRLVENARAFSLVKSATVSCPSPNGLEEVAILTVMNKVIHHLSINLVRRKSDLRITRVQDANDVANFLAADKVKLYPMVIVKSDRGSYLGFRLADLAIAFEKRILDPIVEYCEDRGLYLENMDPD